jgi:hypothetical protein
MKDFILAIKLLGILQKQHSDGDICFVKTVFFDVINSGYEKMNQSFYLS